MVQKENIIKFDEAENKIELVFSSEILNNEELIKKIAWKKKMQIEMYVDKISELIKQFLTILRDKWKIWET